MKNPPTLADAVYGATFKNEPVFGFKDNAALRALLVRANRFRLTPEMSGFLGELSTRAFVPLMGRTLTPEKSARLTQQAEAMRVSAIAPHAVTWIEYDLRAATARTQALLGRPYDPKESPQVEGLLIERYAERSPAFRMHIFSQNPDPAEVDQSGFSLWCFPVTYAWTVDDTQPPWPSILKQDGMQDAAASTGLLYYRSPCVSVAQSELMLPVQTYRREAIIGLLREWTGVTRRVWALLATLGDLPILRTDVRASKGFVARGRYRRFLDHAVITITVPQAQQTKLAKNLIALVRRRAHQVREHWRLDWRNPPSKMCPAFLDTGMHAWTPEQRCEICGGRRIRIHEHQRGDASLGFVTHDYLVKHGEESQ